MDLFINIVGIIFTLVSIIATIAISKKNNRK